jgi:hypothetical protein
MSSPPDPTQTEVTLLSGIIADVIALLGLAGVAVPAFLQSPQVILQVSGAIVAVIAILWSRYKTTKAVNALTQMRLTAAARRKGTV